MKTSYFVKWIENNVTYDKTFDKLYDAVKFFTEMDSKGFMVSIYNMK